MTHPCKRRSNLLEHLEHLPKLLLFVLLAQVPCAHAVDLARAALADNPHGTRWLREFASLPEQDAEAGAHRIFAQTGLAAPIPISYIDLGHQDDLRKWPLLKFSHWLRYLIDTDRLGRQLCGVSSDAEVPARLRTFWRRFKDLHPEHDVFVQARQSRLDLSRAVPMFSHTDEGRTQRKLAIMVVSLHSCIGRGTQQWLEDLATNPAKRDAQGLNFVGSTWGNQFLFSIMRRALYQKRPEALEELFRALASDLAECGIGPCT